MPGVILRITTEQTEGNVYQHSSLSPSSRGHVIQHSSRHYTRSRGEKFQAPSFPWSDPTTPGEPHPTLLSCISHMWTKETLLSIWAAVDDTTALFWRRRGSRIRCWDAANLELLCENRPRSKTCRGDNTEKKKLSQAGQRDTDTARGSRKGKPEAGAGEPFETGRWREAIGKIFEPITNQNKSVLARS